MGVANISGNILTDSGASLSSYLPLTGGTLTGALNGTSATFSGAMRSNGIEITNTTNADILDIFQSPSVLNSFIDYPSGRSLILRNKGSQGGLTLASTGAATFSSSITAGNRFASLIGTAELSMSATGGYGSASYIQAYNTDTSTFKNLTFYGKDIIFLAQVSTDTERMRITSSGNVGIGTSSPSQKLVIVGGNGNQLTLDNTGQTYTQQFWKINGSDVGTIWASTSEFHMYTYGTQPILFSTNNAERMRITASGNVCINRTGTTNSGYPLTIKSISGDYIWKLFSTGEAYAGDAYLNNSDGQFHIRNGAADVWLTQSAGGWSNNSDISIKENLVKIDGALDKVNQLTGYYYNIIDDVENKQVGLIAQDVEKVLPEAVSKHYSKTYEREILGLDYDRLIPILVNAIQEQQAQIEELSAKVTALENK